MTGQADANGELFMLRQYVEREIGGLRVDFKAFADKIAAAIERLLMLEGEGKRSADAIRRIGREVEDHESRLRKLEAEQPLNADRREAGDRFGWHLQATLITAACSVVTGAIVYVVTH